VIDTFYARNYDDAYQQYTKKYVNDPRWTQTDIRLKQPWFDVFDDTGKVVATMRVRDGDTAQDRAQYEFGQRWTDAWRVYRRPDESPEPEKKLSPRAQVAKRIVEPKKQPAPAEQQAKNERGVPYWEIFDIQSGNTIHTFLSDDLPDAVTDAYNWLVGIGAERPELFKVRPKMIPNPQTTDNKKDSADIQRRLGVQDVDTDVAQNFTSQEPAQTTYEIYRRNAGNPSALHRFQAATHPEAMAELERFRQSHPDTAPHEFALRNLPANESIGQHDDEQTQTALDMAAVDFNFKNWADVEMRGTDQAKTAIRRHAVTKLDLAQSKPFNMLGKSRSAIGKGMQKADQDHLLRQIQTARKLGDDVNENFADGKVKGKSRPGRVKRAGASCAGSVTSLRAKAKKSGGEKGKMYHWCANMKAGRKK
jgi:hypothetical protein